jgi:recombination protein RecA
LVRDPEVKRPAPAKEKTSDSKEDFSDVNAFVTDMFRGVNKELGENALIDLSIDDSAVTVKRFTSSGSKQLDYCIRNAPDGGFPEGRITELCGVSGSGKTTLAIIAAANVQRKGGIVVYIDSEQALNINRAAALGLNVKERCAYSPETCTEKIFDLIEKTVLKVKALQKDIPVIVIWDSVAASTPKGELDSEYEQNTIGLQARALRKGLRKINQILAGEKITFVIINHITVKIGVMYGDNCVSPDTKIKIRRKVIES